MSAASKVGLIWAQAANGVIGRGGTMPWHLPEDFAHFRRTTIGHPVIMGRRTWESLPVKSRPLPGRRNIVITSNPLWEAPGAQRSSALVNALAATEGYGQRWIIGGGQIYREALSLGVADTAVITRIDADIEGDTCAPGLDGWQQQEASAWMVSGNGMRYRFEIWHPA